jgi:raffinose/stachyose/melibiose transport system permease protein
MENYLSNKKAILFFVLPALLFFLVLIFVPIVVSVYYSLLKWNGTPGTEVFIGLKNYIDMFTDDQNYFLSALKNAALLAILSVCIQLPIALALALIIARKTKGEGLFRSIYFIPVILSTAVLGQLWVRIYHADYGLLNNILETIGLGSWTRGWLGDETTALAAAFFVMIWQYIGYHMLLMYSQIKTIPASLYEAAEIDGATNFQIATKITFPLIKPMIKVCTIFAVIGSLKTFDLILVLTKGGPLHSTEVPTFSMFRTIIYEGRFGMGSAMAIFILIECLIFTILIMRFFKVENHEY